MLAHVSFCDDSSRGGWNTVGGWREELTNVVAEDDDEDLQLKQLLRSSNKGLAKTMYFDIPARRRPAKIWARLHVLRIPTGDGSTLSTILNASPCLHWYSFITPLEECRGGRVLVIPH
jgi:hypothetical protein